MSKGVVNWIYIRFGMAMMWKKMSCCLLNMRLFRFAVNYVRLDMRQGEPAFRHFKRETWHGMFKTRRLKRAVKEDWLHRGIGNETNCKDCVVCCVSTTW